MHMQQALAIWGFGCCGVALVTQIWISERFGGAFGSFALLSAPKRMLVDGPGKELFPVRLTYRRCSTAVQFSSSGSVAQCVPVNPKPDRKLCRTSWQVKQLAVFGEPSFFV